MLKVIGELRQLAVCLFRMAVRISNYETPCTPKRPTVSSIKVKPCNALVRMVPVYIGSCLKSVLRFKFVILCIYQPGTLYLREQGFEDPWIFFEAQWRSVSKTFSVTLIWCYKLNDLRVLTTVALVSLSSHDPTYRLLNNRFAHQETSGRRSVVGYCWKCHVQ